MFVKHAWYVAAWADEIGRAPVARRICGEPVVLYREADGRASALADFCCHRGAPLSCGVVVDTGLQCGYHGMVYNREGSTVHIPGQVHIPPKARVRAYTVVERDALIWIWMGSPGSAVASDVLEYPYHDPADWEHLHERFHIKANAMLVVDNLMDLSHLAYVHTSTIGGDAPAQINAVMDSSPSDRGLKFTRWLLNSTPPPTFLNAYPFTGKIDRWGEFEFIAPNVVVQWGGAVDENTGARDQGKREGGLQFRVFHGITPETEETCFYFWSVAQSRSRLDSSNTTSLFNEISTAFNEDKRVIERQQESLREFGEDALVGMRSDAARVHMRRVVGAMLEQEGAVGNSARARLG